MGNVPAIAEYVGGGVTPSSVDHRLRPLKQLAKMQDAALSKNKDPGELPVEKNGRAAALISCPARPSMVSYFTTS